MVRAKVALLALLVLCACNQVPDTVLQNNSTDGKERDPVAMAGDGEAAFTLSPRTLERVRISASLYERALQSESARSYESLWKAARTCAWVAEYSSDAVERERHARDGLTYANTALKQQPSGHEAVFYHGVLAGFLGDLDNSYGLDAVREIEKDMKLLIDADSNLGNGGPWRVMGVLQLRAPGPPVSVGSLRNGKKNLEAALEKAPDWPENHLYMAEAEFAWARDKDKPEFAEAARKRLNERLLGEHATAPDGFEFEFAAWQAKAKAMINDQ